MIRPIRDQVLVKRDPPPAMTLSKRLHLPETAREWRGTYGTVMAIGPKTHTVHVGDRLLLPDLGGVEVRDADGALVALMPEDEILCVIG